MLWKTLEPLRLDFYSYTELYFKVYQEKNRRRKIYQK